MNEDEQHALAMLTCPWYQHALGNIPYDTCRNGCWEEPACETGGPFEAPPGWTPEQLTARAIERAATEPRRA